MIGVIMNRIIILLAVCVLLVAAVSIGYAGDNKYVGVKSCKMCHQSEKQGQQFSIWQKSKHAEAYKSLTTAKAEELAKAKGLKKPAAESPECLSCHTITADAKLLDKTFDMKDGVQCELCHGAGSAYKVMNVMKDKAKSVAAGLIEYKDNTAIEKHCKTCHNEKSPTYKEFKFADMWAKIKHSVPK
jgi:excinuclease UvrABC ATPase subunit